MKITKRGQITIPKLLREHYGLNPGVKVEILPTVDGVIIREKPAAKHPVDQVVGILDKCELGEDFSIDDYIEEIRGR